MQQMQENLRLQQQMLQQIQGGAGTPTPSGEAGSELPAAEPGPGSPTEEEQQWWYQGPRTCRSCGKQAYLRSGVCWNMQCVSGLKNYCSF